MEKWMGISLRARHRGIMTQCYAFAKLLSALIPQLRRRDPASRSGTAGLKLRLVVTSLRTVALGAGEGRNSPVEPLAGNGQKLSAEQGSKAPSSPPAKVDPFGDPLPEGAIARIGTNRLRATSSISVIAFSPDGRWLAHGSENGLVHVCEAADGKLLIEFRPDEVPSRPVTELAFSPDGQTLAASGYWSEAVWLVDVTTRKVQHAIPNTVAGQGRWGRQWQGPGFAFTPDGRTLLVGGKDGALHLWNSATGTEQATLSATNEPVWSVTLTSDGRIALTAHDLGELHLWDMTNRKHLRKLAASAKYPFLTALAPDGKAVGLAAGPTDLELWDPHSGRRHQIRTEATVAGLGFTPDGTLLQVAEGNGNVTAWDTRTGKNKTSLTCEGISLREADNRMGPKPSAWFRADGKAMAWVVGGSTIRSWDLTTSQETPRLTLYRQGIAWAGFSADGRLLRAGGTSGELGVWDASTGRLHVPHRKPDLTPGTNYIPAHDRRQVVVVTGGDNIVMRPKPGEGRIFLWDPNRDVGSVPLREQTSPAWYAALTPDNQFVVATEAAGQIRVYDAATGKVARSFDGRKYEYRPTFSPDGMLLATTASDGAIRLYDFATGRVQREMKGLSPARCLAFAPDGQSLASGHLTMPKRGPEVPQMGDGIYMWDRVSGRELRRIPTGHQTVQALSFSPDGRQIASCGFDHVVRLWEAASGQERRRYDGHRGWVKSVDFSPDGRRLASASLDGTALVWQVFDPEAAERPATDLDALWTDLSKDGVSAHRAMAALIEAKGTLAFLRVRVKKGVKPSDDQLKTWLADLGSPVFDTREAAHKEIARAGEMVEGALQRARETAGDAEVQRRLTDLLDRVHRPETRPEQLRDLRAVEVIEHLNNAEARRLLGELAKGAPEARLTREAKAGLARLERK
jgi:WD40 repeat protein